MGHILEYTMVGPLKHVHVQDATSFVLMHKTWQGFGNIRDVIACYIPWTNVGKYIERMKNNKNVPPIHTVAIWSTRSWLEKAKHW